MVFTTSNNSFGPTEISYLENLFCNLAIAANRYEVKNINDPTSGNITEEKESELQEFVDYAKLIMGTIGHKVFIPLTKPETPNTKASKDSSMLSQDMEFSLSRSIKQYHITVNAHAKQTAEGFVVLAGSTISPEDDNTILPGVKEKRKNANVDDNHILQEDVLFSSPSSAAMFVIGKSANGWTSWKTKDGKTLHDLESKE